MKRMILAAGVMLGLAEFTPATAQVVYGGGFGFSVGGPHFRAKGFFGGFGVRPYPFHGYHGGYFPAYGPGWGPGYGNPYFLPPPAGLYPPPYGPPVFGPGFIYPPPPIIVVNSGFSGGVIANNPFANNDAPQPDPQRVVPAVQRGDPDDPNPLGAKKGEFIVISPKKNSGVVAAANPPIENGTVSPAAERVAARPPLERLEAVPEPGSVMKVEADADREFARLMRLGREAFAAEEYGRAVGLLDAAAKVKPTDPQLHFLKAQSHVAAGQYAEAVSAIREGMKRSPNWPTSGFRSRDLYGANPDRLDAHIASLRKALADNPGEPTLQFLLGYQLWFGGNHAEAAELFRSAARGAPGNPLIARFLQEAERK